MSTFEIAKEVHKGQLYKDVKRLKKYQYTKSQTISVESQVR